MNKGKLSAAIEFSVEFYDVDSMHIVWHGNYIKYFEKARCALLEKIGYGYPQMTESGYAFPVTEIQSKYIKPLFFQQRIRVTASLEEYESILRISYVIQDLKTGEVTTKGKSSQVAIKIDTRTTCFDCPDVFIKRVQTLMAQEGL
ncbi:MAG: acyl-CoA thioesterase [Spirochaetaceae bacterium]|nr:acyl-CoA thioesterase [Spirochaetaceae bacterium]MBR2362216.1 acyl-CoA thioesterase [Spirochaetaceae bacterium]